MKRPSSASVRRSMEQRYRSARDAAGQRITAARATANDVAHRATDAIGDNPSAIIAGGLVLGAIAAAVLPGTKTERKALGPVGDKLTGAASDAAQAAKNAGKAKLDQLGLSRAAASDEFGRIIGGILQALASAGEAAANSTKK